MQLGGDELWDLAGKNRAETVIGDVPAHNVKTAGPGMLAPGDHGGAFAVGREQHTRRAVPEQRRGDDIARRPIVTPEGQRAQFDDEEQHDLAWAYRCQVRGASETDDA